MAGASRWCWFWIILTASTMITAWRICGCCAPIVIVRPARSLDETSAGMLQDSLTGKTFGSEPKDSTFDPWSCNHFPGSSNGRRSGFDPLNCGSIPRPGTKRRKRQLNAKTTSKNLCEVDATCLRNSMARIAVF